MLRIRLFAARQERERKLSPIGAALSKLSAHMDIASLAVQSDAAAPRAGGVRRFPPS
ncbi:transposase [Pandoraea sputorum]|uniref:Transposase n=1 Tax=Pandoraea sputorum TaxID=93222 RepID=A0A5E5BJV9_9BURK|nr:transposase [Pandoraea sputorum]